MIRDVWRDIKPLLPGKSRRCVTILVAESIFAGLLEATLLVLIVGVALAVANGGGMVGVSVPLRGALQLDPGRALIVAATAGLAMLGSHLHVARLTAYISAGVLETARERIIAAFMVASWARQAQDREGGLQEAASTLATQTSYLVILLCGFAAAVMGLAALLLAALAVHPIVTLSVLLFGTLLFFAIRPLGRITHRRGQDFVARNSDFTERMSEWSTLAMELRVFGVQGVEARRLSDKNRETSSSLRRVHFVARLASDLYRDFAVLFLVCAVAALYFLVDADLPSVGAVMLLIVRSLSYAQSANAGIQQINQLKPNLESLLARLESFEMTAEPVGFRTIDAVTRLNLEKVGYDYAPGRPGIDGITIDIVGGEAVGIIGPSGGGKSTLVQVLLRLRPPTRGTVRVSGVPYEEVHSASWSRLVALVPQEPKLYWATVADNIAFLRPGITRVQVEEAAAAANVFDDIRQLPQGFDTELGPRGAGLSGGQKQRIAIARALVGEPQLLILDEPSSALDVRSEQLLQRTIEGLKGRITLLIVAHRLTTLSCCDRIVAMDGGRVKVIGTLTEALAETSLVDDARLETYADNGSDAGAS